MERSQITTACAHCGEIISAAEDGCTENISHGICDDCIAKHFPEYSDLEETIEEPKPTK